VPVTIARRAARRRDGCVRLDVTVTHTLTLTLNDLADLLALQATDDDLGGRSRSPDAAFLVRERPGRPGWPRLGPWPAAFLGQRCRRPANRMAA